MLNQVHILVDEATATIETRILEMISKCPTRERYALMLFNKLVGTQDAESLLESCHRIADCVTEYSKRNINNPDNFIGLQINKLLHIDNESLLSFANDVSIENLKKLITEEKIIDIVDHDLDDREFIDRECPICNGNKCEIIKNDTNEYYACMNCWMPIT